MLNIGVGVACIILPMSQDQRTGIDTFFLIVGIINIVIGVI